MKQMMQRHKNTIILILSSLLITYIAGYPMFQEGIGGHLGDLTYHLLRIESVKEALGAGCFPPRVNPVYFEGYGYGTSLFYPDIFLVIPALLNLVGISPLMSYKIFMLLVILTATFTTYYAMKFICNSSECALLGTGMLMLSTFYIADINARAGMSEVIAYIFIPLLMVGIYDYFAYEGKRVYLMGIAFVGMALSHTIMTFIGLLLTTIIFVGMLFVPSKKRVVFEKARFGRLLLTAIFSVIVVSYYVFPMLEQMVNDRFGFNEPWAQVGSYVQTVESFFVPVGVFLYNAKFGVGVPILVLLAGRVFLGKVKNRWADFFICMGLAQFAIMTDMLFWVIMEETVLNMIQFPYRFYPYALFMVICGMTIVLNEKKECKLIGYKALVFLAILTAICGLWEAKYCCRDGYRESIDSEYLYENTCMVGRGEWVPEGVTEEVLNGEAVKVVLTEDGSTHILTGLGYNDYQFKVDKVDGCRFIVPLLYYKGYEAELIDDDGNQKALEVSKSHDGLVCIDMSNRADGIIHVWYAGTMIQKISNIISSVAVLGVSTVFVIYKTRKRKRDKCESVKDICA